MSSIEFSLDIVGVDSFALLVSFFITDFSLVVFSLVAFPLSDFSLAAISFATGLAASNLMSPTSTESVSSLLIRRDS